MRVFSASRIAALALLATGCPEPPPPADPLLPMDYLDTYVEVRDCRQSGDHDLNNVRVLADPAALGPYTDHASPYPVGATIVKEQYDFGDADCSGPIVRYTVMQRLEDGEAPADIDWAWQSIDPDFRVIDDPEPWRCPDCHRGCDTEGAYMGTCTDP